MNAIYESLSVGLLLLQKIAAMLLLLVVSNK